MEVHWKVIVGVIILIIILVMAVKNLYTANVRLKDKLEADEDAAAKKSPSSGATPPPRKGAASDDASDIFLD